MVPARPRIRSVTSSRRHAEKREVLPDAKVRRSGSDQIHEQPDDRRQEVGRRAHRLQRPSTALKDKIKRAPVEVFHEALDNIKPVRRGAFAPRRWCHLPGAGRSPPRAPRGAGHPLADQSQPAAATKTPWKSALQASCWTLSSPVAPAVKKREDTHKMAEANKAFSHYRW